MHARFWLLPLLLIASGCASKYPYPPQFVSSQEVSARSIPQPPAPHSKEYNAEIDSIIAMQAKLTPEEIKEIAHQDTIVPQVILLPVLGAKYNEAQYPALYTLMKHAASDAWRIGDDARDYWKSPRPWYSDNRIALHVEPIYSYGYPSGHTTTFGVWAYVLSDLFPQHTDAFFENAWSVGGNRIKGGAHFPHDIAGGKQMAAAIYARMKETPAFKEEFAAALAEIKHPRAATLPPAEASGSRAPARPSLHRK